MRSSDGISAVLIAKNEESLIGRCLRSLKGVDQVVVLDTGSTDGTVDVARAEGAEVFPMEERLEPFHFARARNLALERAKHDWCVSLDADEVAHEGFVEGVRGAALRRPDCSAVEVDFILRGRSGRFSVISKIKAFRRSDWLWRHRVHECLVPRGAAGMPLVVRLRGASTAVEHIPLPREEKAFRVGQNLDLLRLCVKESPEHLIARKRLAQELILRKQWAEAIPHMEAWISGLDLLKERPAERCDSLCHLGECHAEMGDLDGALAEFRKAAEAAPFMREPRYRAAWWLIKSARLDEALAELQEMVSIKASGPTGSMVPIDSAWDDHDDGEPRRMIEFCESQIAEAKKKARQSLAFRRGSG